jgi:acyl-CoA synthetase (AMP-forming)/AMP-acid ligase II
VGILAQDYAIIFYTSGTTGRPKGVLVNYRQLEAPPQSMTFFVDFNEKDIILCALPFSHLGGLIYIQNCISFALTMVLMERFIPLEFLKNIQHYQVTCFWVVPSMYYALLQLKEFESYDLLSLRWVVIFGAPSSPDALRRFSQYCPASHLLNGWGLTETNAPTCVIPLGSKKVESVGRPAPWIEVKIFAENDREVSGGQVGEIVVRGWVVTDGYYKDPEATAQAIRNGWFHTGDLGRFDSESFLYIVGRKKEMIKVGGEIVFEPEVEAAIHKHPDVCEVAVIGVPDKLRGEVPKAFVVLKDGAESNAEELRYFCRQHLAHFKIPHYFEFSNLLPKNRTGKIDKEKLRQTSL